MAKCKDCEQEMLKAKGCLVKRLRLNDGKIYTRLKYEGGWGTGNRCGDCGAKEGYYHHHGCDVERCPKCGNQLITCDC